MKGDYLIITLQKKKRLWQGGGLIKRTYQRLAPANLSEMCLKKTMKTNYQANTVEYGMKPTLIIPIILEEQTESIIRVMV